MPPKTKQLVASRHGAGRGRGRPRKHGGSFASVMKSIGNTLGTVATHAAPVVIPIAAKALLGAGKGKKGGRRRNRRLIGYY